MPAYTYVCRKCDHSWDETHRIDDRKIPLSQPCPSCGVVEEDSIYQQIGAPMICDPVRVGVTRPDTGFKEVLQKIDERAPGSQLKQTSTQL